MEIVKRSLNSIDLENGKLIFDNHEIRVIVDNDNITWFIGKDMCKILELKDSSQAIRKQVDEDDKIKLEDLNNDNSKPVFKRNEKSTILINESGLYNLLIKSNMPKSKEFKQFMDINLPILKNNLKLKNYNKIDNFKNIFDFINSRNYTIKLGKWFKDIWFPLFNQKNIIITNNILNFLYNQSFFNESDSEEKEESSDINSDNDDEITANWTFLGFKYKKDNYIKFLEKNDINFTKIKYSENLIKEYSFLEEDIKILEPHNITWIYMTVKDFKESVMLLNTDNAKEIKKYYITLEEILFDYMKYTKDYKIKKSEFEKLEQENKMLELESNFNNQLSLKDEKVLELETKVNKLSENQLKFKKLLSNIKTHQTKGYIYIATTKEYAKNTIFKIGNTENLRKRQSNYQTGRSSLDSFYFCYYRETYYPKSIDKYIQLVLKEFKDKKNSEMYIIHFVKLKKLIDVIIDNYNKSFKEINKFIENELEESYDLDVFIPTPILI